MSDSALSSLLQWRGSLVQHLTFSSYRHQWRQGHSECPTLSVCAFPSFMSGLYLVWHRRSPKNGIFCPLVIFRSAGLCASFCCHMSFFLPHQTCFPAHFSSSVKRISLRIGIAALSECWSVTNETSMDPYPDTLRRWQNRRRRANGNEANQLRVARGGHLRRQPRERCTSV